VDFWSSILADIEFYPAMNLEDVVRACLAKYYRIFDSEFSSQSSGGRGTPQMFRG
jgi:hypothetical protein